MKRPIYILNAAILLILAGCAASRNATVKKPNIIFILADDLGYMDLNVFATKTTGVPASLQFYETPNIDKLAQGGISFSQAYVNPLCSPTRASVLTGRNAAKLGFMTATGLSASTFYTRGEKAPAGFVEQDALWGDKIDIEQALINGYTNIALASGQVQDSGKNETSFAENLDGYRSAFLGKWHLGGHGSAGYQPHDQGFEEIAYFDEGSSPFYNWKKLWNRKEKYFPGMRQPELVQGKTGEDTGKDYLTDDLTQQAIDFIDNTIRQKSEKPFLLYFCEFAVHAPLQAPKELINYFENKPTKGWNDHSNATYAAMIKTLDNSVGSIMEKLKQTGLDKNTMVIFLSDNGGISYDAKMPNGLTTSNAPLKGGKATMYEGGIRVPLIIWQDGKIKPGQWSDIPVDGEDIFPTLMQVAGQKSRPSDIDGMSIVPLFSDPQNVKKEYTRNTFYWHYPLNVKPDNPDDDLPLTPHSAIRKGEYKLIYDWYGRLKLYDIKNDISEKNNLAFEKPDITRALYADLISWLEANVEKKYFPTLNPVYNPAKESHKVPFADLYGAYKRGEDIMKIAHK